MWRDPSLLELIDHPRTFPKVWELLGWNIQIYHTVTMYSPQEAPEDREVRHLGWHQDSGAAQPRPGVRAPPDGLPEGGLVPE